jgi:iron complex outermembrane recepter protein
MTGKALCCAISASIVAILLVFASIRPAEAQSLAQAQPKNFNVPAQSATTGVPEFAHQAGIQILVSETLVHGKRTAAVTGSHSIEEALEVLLRGTGLIATSRDGVTYTVAVQPAPTTSLNRTAVAGAVADSQASSQSVALDEDLTYKNDIEEITVTGTHIRGTTNSPSPVLVFTRDDIDAAGVNTIQDFLQSLPQNFGGASANTISAIAGPSQTNNTVNGSAPNLRGLGASATLVLINGHRVAPGNSNGSFVDISMIPLTAVERIEIVTDGASAIYGSEIWTGRGWTLIGSPLRRICPAEVPGH